LSRDDCRVAHAIYVHSFHGKRRGPKRAGVLHPLCTSRDVVFPVRAGPDQAIFWRNNPLDEVEVPIDKRLTPLLLKPSDLGNRRVGASVATATVAAITSMNMVKSPSRASEQAIFDGPTRLVDPFSR
jgi:hypothetical protein